MGQVVTWIAVPVAAWASLLLVVPVVMGVKVRFSASIVVPAVVGVPVRQSWLEEVLGFLLSWEGGLLSNPSALVAEMFSSVTVPAVTRAGVLSTEPSSVLARDCGSRRGGDRLMLRCAALLHRRVRRSVVRGRGVFGSSSRGG